MKKNYLKIARYILIITMVTILIIFLLIILGFNISRETNGLYISLTPLLFGTIPPIISLFGYSMIIIEEKEVSFPNYMGLLSSFIIIVLSIAGFIMFLENPFFTNNIAYIVIFGVFFFFIWFALLFDRYRYVSEKIKTPN